MDAEWWDRPGVELHSIYAPDLWVWFQLLVGTDQTNEFESAASNLLALNPGIVCGYPEPVPLWVLRELELAVMENRKPREHPDLIIVTAPDVWIVETKYPPSRNSLRDTGRETYDEIIEGLVDHRERIAEPGWWADRRKRISVIWFYDGQDPDKHAADGMRIHIDQAVKKLRS